MSEVCSNNVPSILSGSKVSFKNSIHKISTNLKTRTKTQRGLFKHKLTTQPGVVTINVQDLNVEILAKLETIEKRLSDSLGQVEQQLASGKEAFQFFQDGLQAYRVRSLTQNATANLYGKWLAKISQDKELRFPHRKILEVLLNQYDFDKGRYRELHFSTLVKQSHVGKNKAQSYLSLLIQKRYIKVRDDGYRLFYKMQEPDD